MKKRHLFVRVVGFCFVISVLWLWMNIILSPPPKVTQSSNKIIWEQFNQSVEFKISYQFDKVSYHGKPFSSKWNKILDDLNLLNVVALSDEEVFRSVPIIGTAISSNHMEPYQKLLDSIRKVHGNKKLVYLYDLGLNDTEREDLLNKFGHVIKELRRFPFDKYPAYFENLDGFRWKPLVVATLLKEFPSVWWMDASVRVAKPLQLFYKDYNNCTTNTCKYYPWQLRRRAGHSIFATTDPRMYEYLPIPLDKAEALDMGTATVQLIFATKSVRENVLRFWVLCALEENCMDPANTSMVCYFYGNRFTNYAQCNRQDQSAIGILLALANRFQSDKYNNEGAGIVIHDWDPV